MTWLIPILSAAGTVALLWIVGRTLARVLDRRYYADMRDRPIPHILRDTLAGSEPRLREPDYAADAFDLERWRDEVESGRFQPRRPESSKVRRIRRAG